MNEISKSEYSVDKGSVRIEYSARIITSEGVAWQLNKQSADIPELLNPDACGDGVSIFKKWFEVMVDRPIMIAMRRLVDSQMEQWFAAARAIKAAQEVSVITPNSTPQGPTMSAAPDLVSKRRCPSEALMGLDSEPPSPPPLAAVKETKRPIPSEPVAA